MQLLRRCLTEYCLNRFWLWALAIGSRMLKYSTGSTFSAHVQAECMPQLMEQGIGTTVRVHMALENWYRAQHMLTGAYDNYRNRVDNITGEALEFPSPNITVAWYILFSSCVSYVGAVGSVVGEALLLSERSCLGGGILYQYTQVLNAAKHHVHRTAHTPGSSSMVSSRDTLSYLVSINNIIGNQETPRWKPECVPGIRWCQRITSVSMFCMPIRFSLHLTQAMPRN